MKKRIYLFFLLILNASYSSLKSMDLSNDHICEGIYDYHLYLVIQRIKNIVEAALIRNRVRAVGGRGQGYTSRVDHYSPQTEKGLLLHIIGPEAVPAYLSTPWGSTWLVGAYNEKAQFQPVVAELLSHIKVELLPNLPNQLDQVYKILSVDGDILALPREQEKTAYRTGETISNAFDEYERYLKKQKLE
jgi:hypothetical protein